jgi:hypothetical protein
VPIYSLAADIFMYRHAEVTRAFELIHTFRVNSNIKHLFPRCLWNAIFHYASARLINLSDLRISKRITSTTETHLTKLSQTLFSSVRRVFLSPDGRSRTWGYTAR